MDRYTIFEIELTIRDYFKDYLTNIEFHVDGDILLMTASNGFLIFDYAFSLTEWQNTIVPPADLILYRMKEDLKTSESRLASAN